MSSSNTEAQILAKTHALAEFTRCLRLLHRLSTSAHNSIDDLLADSLRTGCDIFRLPHGMVTELREGELRIRKLHAPAALFNPEEHTKDLLQSRQTFICAGERCSHHFFLGSPIFVAEEIYGAISFWSDRESPDSEVHPQAREVSELLARSIGVAIYQRRLTDQLAHQAMHDSLTGLPNRLLMQQRLDLALELAAKQGSEAAVVFIDLDRFKQINDTLGHGIGDAVLQHVASCLKGAIKRTDTLARMGGDEFTAILTNFAGRREALQRVRNLLDALRTPRRITQYELFVTGSIGVSFYPHDGEDAATLLRNADSAMYIAKARGKNEIHCFNAEMTATALERLELETRLRRALERSELELLFQPQVDLHGNLAAVEVLLVWNNTELGRIVPSRFIPIAEETGMILNIGSWVLHEACRRMAQWLAEGLPGVTISVNVSALQFAQHSFVATVAEALKATGLPPRFLELEVTESLIMRDVEQSASVMRELRALGVKIAIDDFGTGYSSLSYLRRLPADTLKIDQSFLRDIDSDRAAALVGTIVTLGHALGLSVTAEGVETMKQFEVLKNAKCDRAQGHLIGVAMEAESVRAVLRRGWQWQAATA